MLWALRASAVVLWSDLGATLAHETGAGSDILGGAVQRDDTSSDTLYFKFHVDPLSDVGTEEYFAAFQLYEGDKGRLAVGNSLKAWAYSAFNTAQTGPSNNMSGDIDLNSSRPESPSAGVYCSYELPHRGYERTIVFKVQYVPGGDDRVTVWLNPDLAPGATEASQPESLTTHFTANASFNEIRLVPWRRRRRLDLQRHGDRHLVRATSSWARMPGRAGRRLAAAAGAQQLTFRAWQREQGLPQNSCGRWPRRAMAIFGSAATTAWPALTACASFPSACGKACAAGRCACSSRTAAGALWIGTVGGGLTRWQDGQFTTFTTADGLPADSITALGEDGEGRLWVGTEAGLAVWQNGRSGTRQAPGRFQRQAIAALVQRPRTESCGWAARRRRFPASGRQVRPAGGRLGRGICCKDPHCLLEDKAGRIWVGAGDDFVLCREGNQWRRYRIPRHLARPYVSALAEEPDGTVWAGSVSEGLFQFKDGKTDGHQRQQRPLGQFRRILAGGPRRQPLGGHRRRAEPCAPQHASRSSGKTRAWATGRSRAWRKSRPGVIWAGKPSDGLYRWEGRNFSRVAAASFIRRQAEDITLLMARDGSCWAGGARGLWQFQGPQGSGGRSGDRRRWPGLNVISLAEDRDGGLWAGTREGEVWRQSQGNWVRRPITPRPMPSPPSCRTPTAPFGSAPKAAACTGSREDGRTRFAKGGRLLSDWIRTLYLDAQGVLWIGTAGGGLSRCARRAFATFTTREGLPDNTISQILEDDTGRLWLGSNRGIACVQQARTGGSGRRARLRAVYPQVYGRAEGMPSEECTGGFFPPASRPNRAGSASPRSKALSWPTRAPARPTRPRRRSCWRKPWWTESPPR